MNGSSIDREFGREAFGLDPRGYHAARPAYPEWVFEVLRARCGLAPNAVTFEIGPGTGTATRRLLELGANPLVAVEPDDRLAAFLRETIPDKALTVVISTFEEAVLQEASFDIGLSATAFHWLNEDLALTKGGQAAPAGRLVGNRLEHIRRPTSPRSVPRSDEDSAQRSVEPIGGWRRSAVRSRCRGSAGGAGTDPCIRQR
jgi:SAM-dependent methyltransferase